ARSPRAELDLERLWQSGRKGDNGSDVQVVIGPAIEPSPNSFCERIVDGRVTQRAGDADIRQLPGAVETAFDAHDCVQLQQLRRHIRACQIDVAGAKCRDG